MTEHRYDLQFKQTFPKIYEQLAYFAPAFGGSVETIDGVDNNTDMFTIKSKVDEVVINDKYDTDANKAFGTGTSNSNRFGNLHENKWTNKQVPYTGNYAWNEGLDKHTVNLSLDKAVAEVTADVSEALIDKQNQRQAKALVDAATKEITKDAATADDIISVFDEAKTYFTNNRIKRSIKRRAYVKDEVENILVNAGLTTTAKGSSASVENGHLVAFKGFDIVVVPESFFPSDVDIILTVDNVGHTFVGINTARTITSENFDGVAYQGATKFGDFIPDENKKAIVKAKITGVPVA